MSTPAFTVPFLDRLVQGGVRVEFYDPTGSTYGFPTFPYRYAPKQLATRRQLRAAGLSLGGQEPVAMIMWRHHGAVRVAFLYERKLARPKRKPTPAQLAAVDKALLARRTCRHCGVTCNYYIPRRTGACLVCEPL